MIIDIKLHFIYLFHILYQTKLIIASNTNNKSNGPAHQIVVLVLIAVSGNEGSGKPE